MTHPVVSPPPIMVVAPFSVLYEILLRISADPFLKGSSSNTPIKPFIRITSEFSIIPLNSCID